MGMWAAAALPPPPTHHYALQFEGGSLVSLCVQHVESLDQSGAVTAVVVAIATTNPTAKELPERQEESRCHF